MYVQGKICVLLINVNNNSMACDLCVAFSRRASLKMPEFVGFFSGFRKGILYCFHFYLLKFELGYS